MKVAPFIVSLVLLCAIILALFIVLRIPTTSDEEDPSVGTPPTPPVTKKIVRPPREFVPDWDSLNAYHNTITAEDLQVLIENVYAVGDTWKDVITIETDKATIVTAKGEKFELQLLPKGSKRPDKLKRYWKTGPLDSLHIAIDPGHIGGDYAAVEQRQFAHPGDKQVREGEMALITAKHLKPLLEAMGAKVSLVRSTNAPVTKKRTEDFLQLFRDYNPGVPDGLLKPYADRRFYRRAEIVARAKLVNEKLKPDLVLCLHYNASSGSGDWASPSQPILVDENHFHLLLNGAYTSGEVLDESERFQMLERILQGCHERELALAKVAADVFAEKTGLAAYAYEPNSKRAKNVGSHPYLWARNLLANRSFTCPVLYFEPWVMNNTEIYARAQAGDYEGTRTVAGAEHPSIMREYAQAVAAGIKKFYSGNKDAPE